MKMKQGGSFFRPDPFLILIGLLVTIFITIYQIIASGVETERYKRKKERKFRASLADQRIKKHVQHQFDKEKIIKVDKNVYVAHGYGSSNCVLIEGNDGCVLINAMDNIQSAKMVRENFRAITEKPIEAILLTSFDPDHVSGLEIFANSKTKIYAHKNFGFQSFFDQSLASVQRKLFADGYLIQNDQDNYLGNGIGKKKTNSLYEWNIISKKFIDKIIRFEDKLEIKISDIDLELVHCPAESDDNLIVWWNEKKILFPGKNIFSSMPNKYGITGGYTRDPLIHVKALDSLLKYPANVMIPTYTKPSANKEEIKSCIEAHRDVIQYLHDQTVHLMNKGYYPDTIVHEISLPKSLLVNPSIQEYYGCCENIIRGIFNHYIGWFSADPNDLHPISYKDEAEIILELAQGSDRLFEGIQQSTDVVDYFWALEISEWLINAKVDDKKAKELQIEILEKMSQREFSTPNRNWYLSYVHQLKNGSESFKKHLKNRRIDEITSIKELALIFRCMVDPQRCDESNPNIVVLLEDPQNNEKLLIELRNNVIQIHDNYELKSAQSHIKMSLQHWKAIFGKPNKEFEKQLDSLSDVSLENPQALFELLNCLDFQSLY